MPEDRQEALPVPLLLVLAVLSATAPLSIDFYLASFPEVLTDLHTTATEVQLTLTGFLVGLGAGQVLWGPVTDRFGRRLPLLVGCVISALAATVAAFAPTIEVLVAARFVQALAGAAGVVISRAVVADYLTGPALVRAMSLLLSINSVAPIAAPIVGGALAGRVSWRGILAIVVCVTVVQLVGVVIVVRESLPAERRTTHLRYSALGALLRRRVFVGYALTSMFAFGAMMAYISSSSFVYQSVIGTTSLGYGLGFAVNAVGLMLAGLGSARLARRSVPPTRTVARALPITLLSGLGVLAVAVAPAPAPPALLLVPLFALTTSVGFVIGNVGALAIEQSRDVVGSGSAVVGGLTFLCGAVVSPLGGIAGEATAVPLGVVTTCSALLALLCFTGIQRSTNRPAPPPVFRAASPSASPSTSRSADDGPT